MSSQGGRFSFPGVGAYSATKFALEGLSEALAQEVAEFGIKVLIVEPGSFRTGLLGGAMTQSETIPGTRTLPVPPVTPCPARTETRPATLPRPRRRFSPR